MATGVASFYSFEDIIGMASIGLRDYGMNEFVPGTLRALAGEANREFARLIGFIRTTELRPLVLGQQYYDLPENCEKIEKVSIKYPGDTGFRSLPWRDEEHFLTGFTSARTGRPSFWFPKRDLTQFGLYPVPPQGGLDGRTTSSGSPSIVNYTGISANDAHKGQTLRILDGPCMGESGTVSTNTTGTLVMETPFTATIGNDVRFQVYTDTISLTYITAGNDYFVLPTAVTVCDQVGGGYANPRHGIVSVTGLAVRPINFWKGCQIKFTSGTSAGFKGRVIASKCKGSGAGQTQLQFSPEMPSIPANGDVAELCDVPNVPDAYHASLVYYIMGKCLQIHKPQIAEIMLRRFEVKANQCSQTADPDHNDVYAQVKRWAPGERRR